ncbi:iron transporter [Natronorubrum thiooxidans]|uniref:Fe2+ transport protein n=1 Tax=Natronorubrum thiooxidans TaxID=308853 RepID=A0A1N7FYE7_9EURY|nr:iron transporter [Natronorubrum thiooxidans]SIS05378.1 Fe2+ transport protein [Natronorubrum thiooxidans]
MRRRTALAAGGCLLTAFSAGCLETLRRDDAWRELVVDPPDGVYVPPHVDETMTYGTATTNGWSISLAATRPHSFWPVAGTERSRADVRSRHALHLMVGVHDADSGVIVPTSVTTTIRRQNGTDDGERVDERSLWPMLSQRMGPHYGDNVVLDGDGTYAATVHVGPANAVRTESLADRLDEPTTIDLEFTYNTAEIEGLERRLIDADEGRGESSALEPMADHPVHRSAVASGGATRVGVGQSGDVVVPTAHIKRDARSGFETPLLAVTPQTRHNRYPLLFMSLSATVSRGGDRIATEALAETIDAQYGHCYSTTLEPDVLERGDELTLTVETPPQMARHEGYETAFLERGSTTIGLE